MAWTDEKVELLKKYWADGLSASQIANRFGDVTRNAVIGKVHRLGLSGRGSPGRPARPRKASIATPMADLSPTVSRPASAGAGPRLAQLSTQPVEDEIAEAPLPEAIEEPAPMLEDFAHDGTGATVLTLTEHTCKWPIGDPGKPDFHFCGRRSASGSPYCAEHSKMAYQPIERRRDRERNRERERERARERMTRRLIG